MANDARRTPEADAIVIERLTKPFGERRVVRDLNLRVFEGCVYGFLDRNGAGKSTTLKMLVSPPTLGAEVFARAARRRRVRASQSARRP